MGKKPQMARKPGLSASDEALLQGHWDTGAFGIAEVIGTTVFYSELQNEFQLGYKDKLLTLGLYRARLHATELNWEIRGRPEEAVTWRRVGPAPVVEPQPPEASMVDVVALDTPPSAVAPVALAPAPKPRARRRPAPAPVKTYNLRPGVGKRKEQQHASQAVSYEVLPPMLPPAVCPPEQKPIRVELKPPSAPLTPEKEASAASPPPVWGLQRLIGPSAPPGEHTCAVCCALLRPMAATPKADLLREKLACDSCGRFGRGIPARDFLVCGDDLQEFLIWANSDRTSGRHIRCCTYSVCRLCAQLPHQERRPRKRARHA